MTQIANVISNLPEVAAVLRGLGDVLNMSKARRSGQRLGDTIADAIAVGIIARTLDEQIEPSGEALAANRGKYGAKKREMGLEVGIGLYGSNKQGWTIGGDMLSFDQVRGMVAMTENRLVMEYGIDQPNKDKADWFTSGNDQQPARKFYELDDKQEDEIEDIVDQAAGDTLQGMGAV